jgi:hypothetical protein
MIDQDRIGEILQRKAAKDANQDAATRQAEELAKQKSAAPAQWATRWQTFQNTQRAINESLAQAKMALELDDRPQNKAPNELAMFQLFLVEEGQRCESFMTCTVSDRGDLFLNRRLPSLHDGKCVRADALNDAMIEDILLRFVENAQGCRSVAEMTTDYDPAVSWPR